VHVQLLGVAAHAQLPFAADGQYSRLFTTPCIPPNVNMSLLVVDSATVANIAKNPRIIM
jgi:hypothetical protein